MINASEKTLRAILVSAGISASVADACVAGRLSRTFGNREVSFAWKIRDTYYRFAEESVVGAETITVEKILFKIMPEWSQGEFALDGLTAAAQQVRFKMVYYRKNKWQTPLIGCTHLVSRVLLTAIRLYYISTIWQNNPNVCEANFSNAVLNFDDNSVAGILEKLEPSVPRLTANQRKLLDFLAEAPRSRREIEHYLHINRSDLLQNYLYPARNAGWIIATNNTTPTSPRQHYALTEAGKQVISHN